MTEFCFRGKEAWGKGKMAGARIRKMAGARIVLAAPIAANRRMLPSGGEKNLTYTAVSHAHLY